jgi:O-antigen/teichoic acid export membrane protein
VVQVVPDGGVGSMLDRPPTTRLAAYLTSLIKRGSIAADSFLSLGSLGITLASNAVLAVFLARLVDITTLGEILYGFAFVTILSTLASCGFDNLVIREVAQGHYSVGHIAPILLSAKVLVLAALALAVAVFVAVVPVPLKEPGILWYFAVSALVQSLRRSVGAIRKGEGDFLTDAAGSVCSSGILLGGTVAGAVLFGANTLLVGKVRLTSSVAGLVLVMALFAWRSRGELQTLRGWPPSCEDMLQLLAAALPFALHALFSTAYFQFDVLILGALGSSADVACYQAAMQVVSVAGLVFLAVMQAGYPRLASALASPDTAAMRLQKRTLRVLGGLGFCLTLVVGLGAPMLMPLVYGTEMRASIILAQILSLVLVVRAFAGGLGISLMSVGLQRVQVLAGFVALVTSVSLNLWLIPRLGGVAAAWVNVATNVLVLAVYGLWWRSASVRLSKRAARGAGLDPPGGIAALPARAGGASHSPGKNSQALECGA